jgi:hypothetical protein
MLYHKDGSILHGLIIYSNSKLYRKRYAVNFVQTAVKPNVLQHFGKILLPFHLQPRILWQSMKK